MSRRSVIVGLALALIVAAVFVEAATSIHLTFASNYSVVHARPGQVLQVALGLNTQHVLSADPSVVSPLATVGGSPPTQLFIGATPGKTMLRDRSLLNERCLAMLCGWRVEVDVG